MRNVILAVVLICALTAAGVGGVFAGYSDSEISYDNYISTGSLDLKVNGQDDLDWGVGVPAKVEFEDVMPCKYYEAEIEVQNMGQSLDPEGNPEPAYLYIYPKHFECSNVPPTHDGYPAPDGSGMKPEPELVAEYGGWVDQVEVPGIGRTGDDCSMKFHTNVEILFDGVSKWGPDEINNLILAGQIYLGELEPCGGVHKVKLVFHLKQRVDTDWEVRGLPEKFKYWPTNALMKDRLDFDIEFDLLQEKE